MITSEMKAQGISCRDRGTNCSKCKDKVDCVDFYHFVQSALNQTQQFCYQCHGECQEIYQVRVIDGNGKMTHEKVCSINCATEVQQELYYLHLERAQDMKNQHFQKLR